MKNLIISFIALSCIKGWAYDFPVDLEKSVVFISGASSGTNETFYCTGTAISKRVIVTAAHCVYLTRNLRVYWKDTIRGRDLRWRRLRDNRSIRVLRSEISDDYNTMRSDYRGDIALLFLLEDLPPEVNIANLAGIEQSIDSNLIVRFGYGKRGIRSRLVESAGEFQEITSEGALKFFDENSVRGDSGGPLFMQASDGQWYIAGVHSHGGIERDLGKNTAVSVVYYRDWIERMLARISF